MSKPLGLGVKVFSASLGVFIPKCFHNKLFRGREAGFALRTPWPLAGLQAGGTAGGQFTAPTRGRRGPGRRRGFVAGRGSPGQMGGDASSGLGAHTAGAPVNLCPESVTSRCGSLPRAKNSSFSFESFVVSGPSGAPHLARPHREKSLGGPLQRAAGKAGPLPVSLPLAQMSAFRGPTWGWGAGLSGLSKLLLNAQEVKLVVLGAELGRRLKKSERERETARSVPKATQFENSRSAVRCPRPDPAGRSAAPVLRLSPWRGRPRKVAGHRHCGADQREPRGPIRCPQLCGSAESSVRWVPARPAQRGWGCDAGDAHQAVWSLCRGAESTREGNIWWEVAATRLRRLPAPRLQLQPSQALTVNRGPAGPRALGGPPPPHPRPPAAARGRLLTRSALGPSTPAPLTHSTLPGTCRASQGAREARGCGPGRQPAPCPPGPARSPLVHTQRWRRQLPL